MNEIMKIERTLETNLCILFAILTSLCDSDTRHDQETSVHHRDDQQ